MQFIQDVLNGEENVFEEENVKFTPRLVVTSKEIYQEAFNKPLNNVLDARSNSDIRKIGLIMNSHPGWKQNIRLPDNKTKVSHGYKRL